MGQFSLFDSLLDKKTHRLPIYHNQKPRPRPRLHSPLPRMAEESPVTSQAATLAPLVPTTTGAPSSPSWLV